MELWPKATGNLHIWLKHGDYRKNNNINYIGRNEEFKSHSKINIFAPNWVKLLREVQKLTQDFRGVPSRKKKVVVYWVNNLILYQLKNKKRCWSSSSICCRLKQTKNKQQNTPLKFYPVIIYKIGRVLLRPNPQSGKTSKIQTILSCKSSDPTFPLYFCSIISKTNFLLFGGKCENQPSNAAVFSAYFWVYSAISCFACGFVWEAWSCRKESVITFLVLEWQWSAVVIVSSWKSQ